MLLLKLIKNKIESVYLRIILYLVLNSTLMDFSVVYGYI